MAEDLRRHPTAGDVTAPTYVRARMIRYRFMFVGVLPLPTNDDVERDSPIVVGTVELYGGKRYLVESVDHASDPPIAVLRRVRS
jgi:hypothetical protein